jgi:hypothetical protein
LKEEFLIAKDDKEKLIAKLTATEEKHNQEI